MQQKPFTEFTYEELVAFNNVDKNNNAYINPEPIELEMDMIKDLLARIQDLPYSKEREDQIEALYQREDKLQDDLTNAYNT